MRFFPPAVRLVVAAALVTVACIGPQPSGPERGYKGPTGPATPAETQLRGQVIDLVTLAPVAGATVAIDTNKYVTSADGSYTLQHLKMSAATIETTKAGYDTSRTLIPLEGGDRSFTVRLRPSSALITP